ncbi:MAG: hypothetical protein ACF8TS_21250 [Maioricimonas sp. JB049]
MHALLPSTNRRSCRSPQRAGLTLTEVTISTFLVGLVIVSALSGVTGVYKTWIACESQRKGAALARQMMSEIMQQQYKETGVLPSLGIELPETSLNRALWDDVDDYDGWSSTPEDKSGIPLAGYSGWTRSVAVDYANVSSPQNTAASDQGLKRITVTVTDPSGRQTILVGYRSQWGILEAAPEADATVQSWAGVALKTGQGVALQGGTEIPNHAEDQ